MLISALNDYYDILEQKGAIPPEGLSAQKVSHRIMLNADGTIDSIEDIREQKTDKKGKIYYEMRQINLPKRTEKPGIDFNIIEHRPLYIFGLNYDKKTGGFSAEDNTDKAKKSHECFVKANLEFTEGMTSEIVTAYRNFMQKWNPANETDNEQLLKIAKEYSPAYFCFALAGHSENALHSLNGEIMQKLRKNINTPETPDGVCSVSGREDKIARIHDKIKGIKGGQSTGGSLVCFNSSAEESYGKSQSYNSSISETVMRRYTAALNTLIADRRHKMYVDELTVVFWAMSKEDDDKETDLIMSMLGGAETDDAELNDIIWNAVHELSNGRETNLKELNIDENVIFYIAGLAPNVTRISQKFLYRDKFGKIFNNAAGHQADMLIEGSKGQIPLWRIIAELKAPKGGNENVPPPLIAGIFGAIMDGTKYPDQLLETVLRRVKIDKNINYVRGGIVKACLNRKKRINKKTEEFKMALDKDCKNEGYLCGRLFAVLENVQGAALGRNLNRTIKDSYFSSACSNPASVFPKLVVLAQNHLSKIKSTSEGAFINFDKLIGEITDKLGTGFPNTLSLDSQGAFALGYYQQHQDFFRTNKNNEE